MRQCDIYIIMYSTLMAIFEMNYICKICCLQMCLHMLTVSRLWVCDVVRFGLGNRNSNGKHNFATTHKEPFPLLPRIRIFIYIYMHNAWCISLPDFTLLTHIRSLYVYMVWATGDTRNSAIDFGRIHFHSMRLFACNKYGEPHTNVWQLSVCVATHV